MFSDNFAFKPANNLKKKLVGRSSCVCFMIFVMFVASGNTCDDSTLTGFNDDRAGKSITKSGAGLKVEDS